jgi:hypothetical protein
VKAIDGLRSARSGLAALEPSLMAAPEPDPDSTGPADVGALAELSEIASVLEHQVKRIAGLETALQHVRAADEDSDAVELAARARSQATRIAELENEVFHARAAAEGARMLALREAKRRVEIQTELRAVHRTKLWRYSALPRRLYRGARRRITRWFRSAARR